MDRIEIKDIDPEAYISVKVQDLAKLVNESLDAKRDSKHQVLHVKKVGNGLLFVLLDENYVITFDAVLESYK